MLVPNEIDRLAHYLWFTIDEQGNAQWSAESEETKERYRNYVREIVNKEHETPSF